MEQKLLDTDSGSMATNTNIEVDMPEAGTQNDDNQLLALVRERLPGEEVSEGNYQEMAVTLIGKLTAIQDKLVEVIDEVPEFGSFLNDVIKGIPPDEAAARNFDDLTPPEDSPDWEKVSAAKEQRKQLAAEKKSRFETIEKNKEVSIENARTFIADTGMEQNKAIAFLEWVDKLAVDLGDGLLSPEHFKSLYKSFSYDDTLKGKDMEMADAVETAKAAGRNEQIVAKEMTADNGDGIPMLGSSGGRTAAPKKASYGDNFFKGVI